MWLAYVPTRDANNLTTAIENLSQHFSNLEFEAEHEAEYGFERCYTYEECIELANKYGKASEACHIYLHTCDLKTFLHTMKEMGFMDYLNEVKQFIPHYIIEEVIED